MGVSCGGCLLLSRALRYGAAGVPVFCTGRSIAGVVPSEGGGAAVLVPLTLSLALLFSACSLGQSLDHTSWSPPQVHFGEALHDAEQWPSDEHRAHLSWPLHRLAMCPYAWHLKQRKGYGAYGRTAAFRQAIRIFDGRFSCEKVSTSESDGTETSPSLRWRRRTF